MKHLLVSLLIVSLCISSCSCKPSENVIQTAIAQTQQAKTTNTPIYTATPRLTATITPTATQTPEYFLGDAEFKNGYALTALSIQDPFTPRVYDPNRDKSKRYVAIDVILSNISGDSLQFSGGYDSKKVTDSEGYSYSSTHSPSYDDPFIFYLSLEKGEKIHQVLYFEIPITAVLTQLTIQIGFSEQNNLITASLKPAPDGYSPITEPISHVQGKTLPTIGTPSTDYGYSLTVLDFSETAKPLHYFGNKEGYKFVAVQIELQNISGTEQLQVDPTYTILVDDQGFVYPAFSGISDELVSGSLSISEKTKGWVIFKLPENSHPYYIKYLYLPGITSNYLYAGLAQ